MMLTKVSFKLALFVCLTSLLTGLALISVLLAFKLFKSKKLRKQNKILNNTDAIQKEQTSISALNKPNISLQEETNASSVNNTQMKDLDRCRKFTINKYDKMDLSNVESRYLNFNGNQSAMFTNYLQKSDKPFLGYVIKENKQFFK